MNLNRVILTGNLTRDVETTTTGSGLVIATLGLAVNEREKKGDEWVDRASFFDVTVFGKQAESCQQYLQKGSPVAVDGRLRQDRWTNDHGENRSKVKVVADRVQFLGSRDDRQGQVEQVPAETAGLETPPPAAPGGPIAAGSLDPTEENIKAHCLCKPGLAAADDCPIRDHGIPF